MFVTKNLFACGALFLLEIVSVVLTYPTFAHPDAHLGGASLGGDFGGFHGGYHEAPTHPLVSNDHHGGVSIVGAGGSAHKGTTIDLTKEGGPAHTGLFGGSFISTGAHGKSSGYYQGGGDDHSGLGAYSSALSSYDVGGHGGGGLSASGHDGGEISPVLYSNYKEQGDHSNFGLHSAALHAGFGGGHGAITAPQQFGGGGGYHFGDSVHEFAGHH